MRANVITSPTNQKIKDLIRLRDRKGDRADTSFAVEGLREIARALQSGFDLEELYQCPDICAQLPFAFGSDVAVHRVSQEAFQKIAIRDSRDGVIAVFRCRSISLDILSEISNPLIVAVEDVEKPGNLGAILRTADAAGVHAVVVLDHSVDTWNQNVIRSSLGGVFSVPVISASSSEFHNWVRDHGVVTVAAALSEKSQSIYKQDFTNPLAILLGSEARGLSAFWFEKADHLAQIPMQGVCDSLNVSVAAAIFIYEALRQRGISH